MTAPTDPIAGAREKRRSSVVHNIQYLRILAAVFVLIGHTAHEAGDNRIERANQLAVLRHIDWRMGVDIFFVISGFIMIVISSPFMADPRYPKRFLFDRCCRVIPNYWIFTTAMLAVVTLIPSSINHDHASPTLVVTSYLFIPWPNQFGNTNPLLDLGWTLNYEMFFYMIYAASLWLFGVNAPRLAILIMIGLTIAGLVVPPRLFLLSFWTRPILLEFAGGMMLGLLFIRGVRIRRWLFPLGAVVFVPLLLLLPMRYPDVTDVVTGGLPALMLVSSAALSDDVFGGWPVLRAVLLTGGASSYILYLSHPFSINIVAHLFTAAGWGGPWLYMLCATVFAILMAALGYELLERPIQRLLRGRATTAGWGGRIRTSE